MGHISRLLVILALLPVLGAGQQNMGNGKHRTPASAATPSFVQACPAAGPGGGVTDLMTTCTGVTSGHLLIIPMNATAGVDLIKNNYLGLTTCASSIDTFTQDLAQYGTQNGPVYSGVLGTSGNSAINLCRAAGYYYSFQPFEFAHAGGGLDVTNQTTTTGASGSISVTTTAANDLWFVELQDGVTSTCAVSSGATGVWFNGATGFLGCTVINNVVVAYGVFSSSGSNSVAYVLNTSTTHAVAITTHKAN